MEFDWLNCHFDLQAVTPGEVAEAFEDPFSIRLLPETEDEGAKARFFSLGKTVKGRGLFSVFWTNGKEYRVILCRDMSDGEELFYDRKFAEWLQ